MVRIVSAGVLALVLSSAGRAQGEEQKTDPAVVRELKTLSEKPSGYMQFFGTLEFGQGMRFNNPYRLSTQLGQTGESLSLTAPYMDVGLALSFGDPDGFQHGAALHWSAALSGVPQQVLTPTYLLAYRGSSRWLAYGRFGPSLVMTPETTLGFELGGGFGWFLTGGLAVSGELVGDLYYGAGTREKGITTYPILSGQLGLLFLYEVLP